MTTKQQIDTLRARLDAGWQKIDEAIQEGLKPVSMETFWINLLHDYENACDQMEQSQEQAPLAGMEGRRRWS